MSLLNPPKPFLQTNAWQHQEANSLRYNTSQAGSALPLIYGTTRQQVNLIDFGDYRGPKGKKGKSGPLPIQGQHVGKGGGGGGKKGVGGKKNNDFSIDVAFAICQGPVSIGNMNFVWSSAGVAFFQSAGLNLYTGSYIQTADPVFVGLGHNIAYAGTCYVTGTPMDLGSSPVLPNLSFEVTGFAAGTAGPGYPKDANPANIVTDFLTNSFHGVGFPSGNLDPDILTLYGIYCQAAQLVMSPVLPVQTEAASWLNELTKLTNSAIVWSGAILKFIPYGDLPISANDANWTPNLVPEYSFDDKSFLPWSPHLDTSQPQEGEDDPVLVDRVDPSDVTNWVSIEYFDRANFYNKNIVPQFDQGMIDLYGLKTEPSIQGNCFCDPTPASISARLILQRSLYVRNKYKFQIGWQYMLLEPMDIILITDLNCEIENQPVRILVIEENKNGDFIITAEEITVGTSGSSPVPPTGGILYFHGNFMPQNPISDTTASPSGTLSVWVFLDQDVGQEPILTTWVDTNLGILLDTTTGIISFRFAGSGQFWEGSSAGGVVVANGQWHNFICDFDTSNIIITPVQVRYDGVLTPISRTGGTGSGFDIDYNVDELVFFGNGGLLGFRGFTGGVEDFWFLKGTRLGINNLSVAQKFRTALGRAVPLGTNGENVTGSPPTFFFHADVGSDLPSVMAQFTTNQGSAGTVVAIAGPSLPTLVTSTPY